MVNQFSQRKESAATKHNEGPLLRAIIEQPRVRQIDIARKAGCSRQFVSDVFAGRRKASPRILDACRDLGLPVDVIFRDKGELAA